MVTHEEIGESYPFCLIIKVPIERKANKHWLRRSPASTIMNDSVRKQVIIYVQVLSDCNRLIGNIWTPYQGTVMRTEESDIDLAPRLPQVCLYFCREWREKTNSKEPVWKEFDRVCDNILFYVSLVREDLRHFTTFIMTAWFPWRLTGKTDVPCCWQSSFRLVAG